jgi:pyruvate formate-lyase/glycerol dehydratase family glycyl radical enzyme
VTPRVKALRDWSLNAAFPGFWERNLFWCRGFAAAHHLPPMLRAARAFKHVVENVSLEIRPGELIVGAVPMSPVPESLQAELDELGRMVGQHSANAAFQALMSDEERVGLETCAYSAGAMMGHTAINNAKVLQRGLLGIRADCEARLNSVSRTAPDAPARRFFYEACIESLDAAMTFASRYADLADSMARRETNASRAAELREIARICRKVPAHPAETFHEALQAVWFMHWLVAAETGWGHGCFCPGRTDRYCWPMLEGDLESGRLTRDAAMELLECFFIKYGEWGPLASPQVMIVGGRDADGRDLANELTFMCLEASRDLRILHPSLAVSYHRGTPDRLMQQAADTLLSGCSYPFVFNDDVIVPALEEAGVARQDAVGYVPCACVEITVGGCCNAWVASGYHNWGKMLELAMHDGIDPATGRRAGPAAGSFEQMNSAAELKDAVKAQIKHFVEMEVRSYNMLDALMGERAPLPLLSCVVDDCVEKGLHYFAGGARYNFIEPEAVGPTNVADSLAAIDRLVFKEGAVGKQELMDALAANFEGREELRRRLISGAPKFGNDDDEVDALLVELVDFWCSEVRRHRNARGGPYLPGFLCWIMHGVMGEHVGALPDGRRAGEALAPHIGPAPGRDRRGPTAVINSVAKARLGRALGGVVLNLKFLPDQLRGESREKFIAFLRTAFARGIFEVQITVADGASLRAAQKEPEKHGDLVVRVGGYSAYFTSLSRTLQDEIIARTEQRLQDRP